MTSGFDENGVYMYGVFIQGQNGLVWLSNHSTLDDAREVMDDYNNEQDDFIIILPVAAFRDLDGERTE